MANTPPNKTGLSRNVAVQRVSGSTPQQKNSRQPISQDGGEAASHNTNKVTFEKKMQQPTGAIDGGGDTNLRRTSSFLPLSKSEETPDNKKLRRTKSTSDIGRTKSTSNTDTTRNGGTVDPTETNTGTESNLQGGGDTNLRRTSSFTPLSKSEETPDYEKLRRTNSAKPNIDTTRNGGEAASHNTNKVTFEKKMQQPKGAIDGGGDTNLRRTSSFPPLSSSEETPDYEKLPRTKSTPNTDTTRNGGTVDPTETNTGTESNLQGGKKSRFSTKKKIALGSGAGIIAVGGIAGGTTAAVIHEQGSSGNTTAPTTPPTPTPTPPPTLWNTKEVGGGYQQTNLPLQNAPNGTHTIPSLGKPNEPPTPFFPPNLLS
uniref:AlNc14C212G8941 protein n=1 Tax=Albugo laibachii Nc14 TaxID=890382 RepID=F0WRD6_9STRA|nr:AlNc14C212G8941 [Albugo laibachii Nc14]|eukprot:CCA23899.1 AlNc14C212G8941 [Albugo laibachii Nc14]